MLPKWLDGRCRGSEVKVREIVVRRKAYAALPRIVEELSLGRVCILVEDEITKGIAGNSVREVLESAGVSVREVIVAGPLESEAEKVESAIRGCGPGFAAAVGGGSVIDVCKLAAYRAGVPFISIPTSLSHDGVCSATASLVSNGRRTWFKADPPVALVIDLDVVSSAPRRMIVAGCGDLLSKATAVKDWELARDDLGEYYCDYAARLAMSSYREALEFADSGGRDIEKLAWAIVRASVAMALVGSSRPCSGSEHLFSHYIDTHFGGRAMHGIQVGLGSVLMAKYHEEKNPNWWREPDYSWHRIRDALAKLGAPTTLVEAGISVDEAVEALCNAYKLRPNRYTILHKHKMGSEEARKLIRETGLG